MAASPITSNQVIQDKLFQPTIESGLALIKVSNEIIDQLKEISAIAQKGLGSVDTKSYEGIKKISKEVEYSNEVLKASVAVKNNLTKAEAQLTVAVDAHARALVDEKIAVDERLKAEKDNLKLNSDAVGA